MKSKICINSNEYEKKKSENITLTVDLSTKLDKDRFFWFYKSTRPYSMDVEFLISLLGRGRKKKEYNYFVQHVLLLPCFKNILPGWIYVNFCSNCQP